MGANLPIACTLGPAAGQQRYARWKQLTATSLLAAERSGNRLEVRYRADARTELESLAAAERECCAFLQWTIGTEAGQAVLSVEADPAQPDDVSTVAGLFGV